jgi:hypothetical protein
VAIVICPTEKAVLMIYRWESVMDVASESGKRRSRKNNYIDEENEKV